MYYDALKRGVFASLCLILIFTNRGPKEPHPFENNYWSALGTRVKSSLYHFEGAMAVHRYHACLKITRESVLPRSVATSVLSKASPLRSPSVSNHDNIMYSNY